MTIRQHISNSVMLLIVSLALMSFKTADQSAAEALASRVMGGKASALAFEQIDSPTDYYELVQKDSNARTIITVWGDTYHLSDYANRDWDGLVETFYKVRWQMFFDAVLAAFDAGEPFVNLKGPRVPNGRTKEECERALKLDAEIWDFETQWAHW